MIQRRVRVPGASLHLREAGDGDPLLLLHGWPQHGGMWDPLVAELASDHRVLVPDLRGFGRSDAPPGDYGKHALASDVLALMDAEGIERASVVGHDWGGWIAWLLALEHPERVERFVSLDVPSPRGGRSLARMPLRLLFGTYQVVIASPLLGRLLVSRPEVVRRFMDGITGSGRRLSPELVDGYARSVAEPERARASVDLYRTFLLREVPAIAAGTYTEKELTVPGFVIMGAESAILKADGMPEPEPNLRVATVPRAGHFVVDEAPEEVLGLLRSFLVS